MALYLARRETLSVGTTATLLCRRNPRRRVLIVTNVTSNQLDVAWEQPDLAASGGEFRLSAGDTYIELFHPEAGGIGEAIGNELYAVKTTGAQNVRVLEYEER